MNFAKELNYHSYIRSELIDMLPPFQGWKFCEVGCGAGATLEYLMTRGASYVAGVDIDEKSIQIASRRGLNLVLAADVEKAQLPFNEKEFDCIILADVLEHLYNPWATLRKLMSYLSDNGHVLISLPNIKHYSILLNLIFHDSWTYLDAGILDNSHIRFFTLQEIYKLLNSSGLRIVKIDRNNSSGPKMRLMNRLLFNRLENFITVQYYVMAQKGCNINY